MIERMVTLRGLEPPTKSLGNSCSIHLSYRVTILPFTSSRGEAPTAARIDEVSVLHGTMNDTSATSTMTSES